MERALKHMQDREKANKTNGASSRGTFTGSTGPSIQSDQQVSDRNPPKKVSQNPMPQAPTSFVNIMNEATQGGPAYTKKTQPEKKQEAPAESPEPPVQQEKAPKGAEVLALEAQGLEQLTALTERLRKQQEAPEQKRVAQEEPAPAPEDSEKVKCQVSLCVHKDFRIHWAPDDPDNRKGTFSPGMKYYFETPHAEEDHKKCKLLSSQQRLGMLTNRIIDLFVKLEKKKLTDQEKRDKKMLPKPPNSATVRKEVDLAYSLVLEKEKKELVDKKNATTAKVSAGERNKQSLAKQAQQHKREQEFRAKTVAAAGKSKVQESVIPKTKPAKEAAARKSSTTVPVKTASRKRKADDEVAKIAPTAKKARKEPLSEEMVYDSDVMTEYETGSDGEVHRPLTAEQRKKQAAEEKRAERAAALKKVREDRKAKEQKGAAKTTQKEASKSPQHEAANSPQKERRTDRILKELAKITAAVEREKANYTSALQIIEKGQREYAKITAAVENIEKVVKSAQTIAQGSSASSSSSSPSPPPPSAADKGKGKATNRVHFSSSEASSSKETTAAKSSSTAGPSNSKETTTSKSSSSTGPSNTIRYKVVSQSQVQKQAPGIAQAKGKEPAQAQSSAKGKAPAKPPTQPQPLAKGKERTHPQPQETPSAPTPPAPQQPPIPTNPFASLKRKAPSAPSDDTSEDDLVRRWAKKAKTQAKTGRGESPPYDNQWDETTGLDLNAGVESSGHRHVEVKEMTQSVVAKEATQSVAAGEVAQSVVVQEAAQSVVAGETAQSAETVVSEEEGEKSSEDGGVELDKELMAELFGDKEEEDAVQNDGEARDEGVSGKCGEELMAELFGDDEEDGVQYVEVSEEGEVSEEE